MKGKTKVKDISELPDDACEILYSHRIIPDHLNVPKDEYVGMFGFVVVDDTAYCSSDNLERQMLSDYLLNEELHLCGKMFTLPQAIIKKGEVLKNRWGSVTRH